MLGILAADQEGYQPTAADVIGLVFEGALQSGQ
jgi:hypothetical protein